MDKKILCVLPNASENISGVAFEKYPGGMITVDTLDKIDESIARKFLRMGGYRIIEVKDEEALPIPGVETVLSADEMPASGEIDNVPVEAEPVASVAPRKSGGSKKVITNG